MNAGIEVLAHGAEYATFDDEEARAGELPGFDPARTLLITCSDAELPLGRLGLLARGARCLEVRTPGNIVPPPDAPGGRLATLDALLLLGEIDDVVVCGHAGCRVLRALESEVFEGGEGRLRRLLAGAAPALTMVARHYAGLAPAARHEALVQENVLAQLESLMSLPTLAARLRSRTIRLHGWVYEAGRHRLWAWNRRAEQFQRIEMPGGQLIAHPLAASSRPMSDA